MSNPVTSIEVPAAVARVRDVMAAYGGSWSLCGGWAVDAWVGRPTRDHQDVDIVVFQDELGALLEHLDGWDLLAHDRDWEAGTSEQWDGKSLAIPGHIHGRSPQEHRALPENGIATLEDGFWLDIQVNERTADVCVLNRDPHIALPLGRCIRESAWGVPTLAEQAVLFYKAIGPLLRRHDQTDFRALLPHLDGGQREWLRDAIARVGHPWLAELSAAS